MQPDNESWDSEDQYLEAPHWLTSDDEDLTDLSEIGYNLTAYEWANEFESDEDDDFLAPRSKPASAPRTRDELKQAAAATPLGWVQCHQLLQDAERLGEWALVEPLALEVMRISYRGRSDHSWALTRAARRVLAARCGNPIHDWRDIRAGLEAGRDRLASIVIAVPDARRRWADSLREEASRADEMLLLLTDAGNSAALAQLAKHLRDIRRSDLAQMVATTAIDLDPDNPAAYVSRAAARADLRNHKGALEDLDQDVLVGNSYAALTRAKVLRSIGRAEEALRVLSDLVSREPSQSSVVMLRALAERCGDDAARALAQRHAGACRGDEPQPPSRLLDLLAAKQLMRDGDIAAALALAEVVVAAGPPWERATSLMKQARSRLST